ncbi:MAG: 1-deoxy-D-xylulose-5-phosphate reductoisomerase [Coriobacteriaceae bacterium]|nr:1-deoxy-D-xylulose-5-phosphate reductoisomerase [Coriobacteriaceae bacterium]
MQPTFEGPVRVRVAILGCTGSIGMQALDVCRQHSDKLEVVALSAHSRTKELVAAAREFDVHAACVTDETHAQDPVLGELPSDCELLVGPDGAPALAQRDDVDVVLVAIVGAAGLAASHAVLKSGKRLALANKESLVVGGDLLMPLAAPGQLLPVDSEHGAIYQCLMGENPREAHCIWLTCSGGPFYGRSISELAQVTRHDALAHPTWNMGAKITIDSATLMNKGLERIEAMHLFGMGLDRIKVLIQRESKIHSMVEFVDGSVIAHLGASDMRIPIQYAFSYPERWGTPAPRVDFRTIGQLTFGAPDMEAFRCLKLAEAAGEAGGTLPCVLNAANEIAVDAFLRDELSFTGIAEVVEACMDAHDRSDVVSFEQLYDVDAWARAHASTLVAARG